jgi:hypothetical protein
VIARFKSAALPASAHRYRNWRDRWKVIGSAVATGEAFADPRIDYGDDDHPVLITGKLTASG